MTNVPSAFGTYLRESVTADEALATPMKSALGVIATALESGDPAPMEAFANALGSERAHDSYTLQDMQDRFLILREQLWVFLDQFLNDRTDWNPRDIAVIEGLFHRYRNAFLDGFSDIYQQIQQDLASQAEQIEAQRYTIRELSTPILPLYKGILALPLVGTFDSYRANQVMETLLEAISEKQADIVILDITGVPVVDTGVANYLLQTARAAQLIGAEVILVGIGAEIAQTIVQLGVDLSGIVVYANLQAGINYALSRLGLRIAAQ